MVLTDVERSSLTVYGETISAQMRDETLVLHFMDNAERSSEDGNPYVIPSNDVDKIAELLYEVQLRQAASEGLPNV